MTNSWQCGNCGKRLCSRYRSLGGASRKVYRLHYTSKRKRVHRETDGIVEEAVDHVLIEVRREEEETSESEEAFVSGTDDPCSD